MTRPNLYLQDINTEHPYYDSARTFAERNNISVRRARKILRRKVIEGTAKFVVRNKGNILR